MDANEGGTDETTANTKNHLHLGWSNSNSSQDDPGI